MKLFRWLKRHMPTDADAALQETVEHAEHIERRIEQTETAGAELSEQSDKLRRLVEGPDPIANQIRRTWKVVPR